MGSIAHTTIARCERKLPWQAAGETALDITYAHSRFAVGSVRENNGSTGTIFTNWGEMAIRHLTNGFESESARRILVVIHDVLKTIRLTVAIIQKRNASGEAFKV